MWQTASCNVDQHRNCPRHQHPYCGCRCHSWWARALRCMVRRMPWDAKLLAAGTLLVPAMVVALASCGGSSGYPPEHEAPAPADVTRVDVSGTTVWLQVVTVDGVRCIIGASQSHWNPVLSCDWSTPSPTPTP